MCEQLGTIPKHEEMPADFADFPHIVQIAMNIHAILPDRWEGFSGTYLGKDYTLLPMLANDVYEVYNKAQLLQFITMVDRIVIEMRAAEQKRKALKNKTHKKRG